MGPVGDVIQVGDEVINQGVQPIVAFVGYSGRCYWEKRSKSESAKKMPARIKQPNLKNTRRRFWENVGVLACSD